MYISMKIPEEKKITVPDNLDLAWHAKLAINGLMGTIDPKVYYEPYFLTYYQARPAYFLHWSSMPSGVQPKYLEALALMKCITGASEIQNEDGFIQSFMENIKEDGLMYDRALPDRPWNVGVGYGRKDWNEDYANVAGNGRLINGMWYYYQLTGDEVWKRAMQRTAEKINEIAVRKNDYAYFPDSKCGNDFSWVKNGWPHTNEPGGPQEGNEGSTVFYQTLPIRGLMKWYQVSGDERMLDLSVRLARFGMKKKFYGAGNELDPDVGAERAHTWGHIHGNMAAFRGILDYAIIAGDIKALEFVNDGYQFYRHHLSPQLGSSLGYESCCVGDWPALGIALSDAGVGDYWDDVDYAIRNAATQAQCMDAEAYYKMGQKFAERPKDSRIGAPTDMRFTRSIAVKPIPGLEDTDDVIERSMGAMCNALRGGMYQLPNQMACCTGNGIQGFYYGWEAAIRHNNGVSTVNLFYTRFSPWMDLISYLPYEGKILIKNKTTKNINVRIPGWIRLCDVCVKMNGNVVVPDIAGRYMRISNLTGNEQIEFTFPQPRRTLEITMPDYNHRPHGLGRARVSVNLVGSTIIGFKESGEEDSMGTEPTQIKLYEYPLFYKKYRRGEYAEKETNYYVPPKAIKWY
ncbi:MAG: glycoside hydrolase family 127 protein [Treponema sp.]|nr:glycoside hydrolase family 127 protein [Treponema sp.]